MPSPTIIKILPKSFNSFRMACQIEKVNKIASGKRGRLTVAPTVGRIHSVNGKSLTIRKGG